MDALCAMMEQGTDRLAGTVEQLARVCRCSPTDLQAAVADLQANNAAEIVQANLKQNPSIILVCRKLSRDLEIRHLRSVAGSKGGSKRQANGQAKGKQPLTITLTSDSSSSKNKEDGGNQSPPPDRYTVEQFKATAKLLGIPESVAAACHAHYSSQGWVYGNKVAIPLGADPRSILQRWVAKGATLKGQEAPTAAETERRKAQAEEYL